MQDVFIEYLVKRQNTAQHFLLRVLIILTAVILTIGIFLFSSTGILGAFSMIAPLVAIGTVYGAYYLITSMSVEYEYSVTNGDLDIDQITAQRKRKRLVSVNCKSVEAFGRYKPAEHENKTYQTKIFACDNPQNPEVWYCAVRLKESGLTLVVFNANQKMLDAIKTYLPRPIMHEAFRTGQ